MRRTAAMEGLVGRTAARVELAEVPRKQAGAAWAQAQAQEAAAAAGAEPAAWEKVETMIRQQAGGTQR